MKPTQEELDEIMQEFEDASREIECSCYLFFGDLGDRETERRPYLVRDIILGDMFYVNKSELLAAHKKRKVREYAKVLLIQLKILGEIE